MEMNHNAPGNISQKGVNSEADNETGFDPRAQDVDQSDHVDEELGFDPESPVPSADTHEKSVSGPGGR